MRAVPGEQIHSPGGERMGRRSANLVRDGRIAGVLRVLGADGPGGTPIRDDVRGTAGSGRGSESARDTARAADASDSARRSSRRRRAVVKLAMYYMLVSLAFFVLSVAAPDVADAAVVGFIGLLLVPACYSELLRVRKR